MAADPDINNELWYGFGSDQAAEALAAKSLAARVGRVLGAKPFPMAARRLAQITKNPDCSFEEVVKVLEHDPALSVRLLRLVNSAGFALRTACTSVSHAAALVGIERINQVASTAAIMDMYGPRTRLAGRVLQHTTVVGALSRYLGFHLGQDVDELFTCGFLHDIGKLMLLDTDGDDYGRMLREVGFKEGDKLHLWEREKYGFDHALLGGHVLSAWSIPDPIPKVVAWHHNVGRANWHSPEIATMVNVIRLADALSYALRADDHALEIAKLGALDSSSYLDISEPQIAAMWGDLKTLESKARIAFRSGGNVDSDDMFNARPSLESLSRVRSARPKAQAASDSAQVSERPRNKWQKELPQLSTNPVPLVTDTRVAGSPAENEPPFKSVSEQANTVSSPAPSIFGSEAPESAKYPCLICAKESDAETCPACGKYVCAEHQEGGEQWCTLCTQQYQDYSTRALPLRGLLVGSGVGALFMGAMVATASVAAGRSLKAVVGPTLILICVLGLIASAQGWIRKFWFRRARAEHKRSLRAASSAQVIADVLQAGGGQAPLILEKSSELPQAFELEIINGPASDAPGMISDASLAPPFEEDPYRRARTRLSFAPRALEFGDAGQSASPPAPTRRIDLPTDLLEFATTGSVGMLSVAPPRTISEPSTAQAEGQLTTRTDEDSTTNAGHGERGAGAGPGDDISSAPAEGSKPSGSTPPGPWKTVSDSYGPADGW